MTRVLLVEPYFTGSHQAWAQGFKRHSRHEVELLTLPGRFWKWRMFGGSLTLAHRLEPDEQYDVLMASDMLDVASFLGHANRGFQRVVLYMHENQLTYPLSPTARDDLAYAYMNWSSMVRADEVWFNSVFHLEAVFEALPSFLKHFPDHRHVGLIDSVRSKSVVMPVGVEMGWIPEAEKGEPPLIVWSQRWEYDKDPVRLFQALYRLADSGAKFRLAICGENFRNIPGEFEDARDHLGEHLVHYGYAEREHYEALLTDASIVVSTAKHEFFGISAVEAMAAGAVPVFPNDLSYPELIPEDVHGATLYESDDELDILLKRAVESAGSRDQIRRVVAPSVRRFGWEQVAPTYDSRIG